MFCKPFKVKSNTPLKNSDSKRFRLRIKQSFPHITKKQLQQLIPIKSVVNVLKTKTYSGFQTSVFCVDKRPVFFEAEGEILVPSLHTIWIIPDLLPYFKTYAAILPRLSYGVDLHLNVVVPEGEGDLMYGRYEQGQLIAINLTTDESAAAVGVLTKSSEDLRTCSRDESAVKILHIFGDKLWKQDPSQVPKMIPKACARSSIIDKLSMGTDLVAVKKSSKETLVLKQEQEVMAPEDTGATYFAPIIEKNLSEDMGNIKINSKTLEADAVLRNAFFSALKHHGKDIVLPLLTSNFYRLYVVPESKTQIDLKKTKYKKLSNFLNEMIADGFIVVQEETKGIDKIISIAYDHPKLMNSITGAKYSEEDQKKNSQQTLYHSEMTELYLITDEVMSLFGQLNYKQGDSISGFQLRNDLREYVSKKNLPLANGADQFIKLDTCLRGICRRSEAPLWKIYNIMIGKMKHTYEMRSTNGLYKNKPFIRISLATRSGNRKITRVSNIECYGIILSEFIKLCKKGAATSTTIVKVPNQCREMLQMQGDQVCFVSNLLIETYNIPAENILELDLTKKV